MSYHTAPIASYFVKLKVGIVSAIIVSDPAQTELSLPDVFESKRDGMIRYCKNYRNLDALTKRDSYPFPMMGGYVDFHGDT